LQVYEDWEALLCPNRRNVVPVGFDDHFGRLRQPELVTPQLRHATTDPQPDSDRSPNRWRVDSDHNSCEPQQTKGYFGILADRNLDDLPNRRHEVGVHEQTMPADVSYEADVIAVGAAHCAGGRDQVSMRTSAFPSANQSVVLTVKQLAKARHQFTPLMVKRGAALRPRHMPLSSSSWRPLPCAGSEFFTGCVSLSGNQMPITNVLHL
jgi:hypothetical protein